MFSGADWIVVIGAVFAGFAGLIAAYWQHRRGSGERDHVEHTARPGPAARPFRVELADEDRSLIRRLIDAIAGHRKAVDDHADILGRHRHAIGDNTAQMRRDDK